MRFMVAFSIGVIVGLLALIGLLTVGAKGV